jgi:hypothetical protein
MVKTRSVVDQVDHAKVLYWGDGGTGKTTDLAYLANIGKVLVIDVEAGIKAKPLEEMGVKVANIELLDFEALTFQEIEDVFWAVKSDLDEDPEAWVGVIWDSGSELYQAIVQELVAARVADATRRGITNQRASKVFVDIDDWGTANTSYRFLMRRYRDLPCHFGASFLPRRDQDKQTGEVHVGPSISPGLQSDLIGWFDFVGHTTYDADRDLFLGTFHPESVNQGKDRYGVMPPILVDPTMDRVIAYMRGELTADDDPRQRGLRAEEVTPDTDAPDPSSRQTRPVKKPVGRRPIPKRK